jgi:hypothetical protein
MQPPTKRATRSNVLLDFGAASFAVTIWSGTYKAPSVPTFCVGSDDKKHAPHKVSSVRSCEACSGGPAEAPVIGEVISGFPDASGQIMPIDRSAANKRVLDVAPLHDKMIPRRLTRKALASNFLPTANVHWLTPTNPADQTAYASLAYLLTKTPMVLVTSWASRTVAKPYLLGVADGNLTLTELSSLEDTREAPAEPPVVDQALVEQGAAMLLTTIGKALTGGEEVARLAIDPGREGLRLAAERAAASGAEALVLPRSSDRTPHDEKVATADLVALLEAELFE